MCFCASVTRGVPSTMTVASVAANPGGKRVETTIVPLDTDSLRPATTEHALVGRGDCCGCNGWIDLVARHASISMAPFHSATLPSDDARRCGWRRPTRDKRRGLGWSSHLHARRGDVVRRERSRRRWWQRYGAFATG